MLKHQGHNSYGNNNYNAYTYCNTGWQPHFHKNLEILYVLKGELRINVNDRAEMIGSGQFALVLSNQIHSFEVDPSTMVWVAVFSEDFVPEFASYIKERQGRTIVFEVDEEIEALLRRYMIFGDCSDMMRRACLLAVCDQYRKRVPTEARRNKNDRLICRVLDYIEEHYTEDISLRSVAEHFGYEYHYFSRLLNRCYNIRFRTILSRYRIEKAVRELERGEMSITEIALYCGFQSIRSFNEVFFAENGVPPSEFRAPNHQKTGQIVKKV